MKLWEKAKERFPALSRMDIIALTCPYTLSIADMPDYCPEPATRTVTEECIKCWDREVDT